MTSDITEEVFSLKCCWGWYDENGRWFHNPVLKMTREEQLSENRKNAYPDVLAVINYEYR